MTAWINAKNFAQLGVQIEGCVSLPGSRDYQEAIYTWNAWVQHRPDFVVSIANAKDAQAAFRFAAEHNIPVAVQSAGHGAAMSIEGGMLISTRRLTNLTLDIETRMATVGAGVKWGDVAEAGARYGLAGLAGSSSDVGVVGYTLGGGMSIIGRKFGWAADRIKSIEIVTPNAELRRLTADQDSELFWGACGGAGNFGVVTEITFELVELKTVYGGCIFYDAKDASVMFNAFFQWTKDLPDEMCASVAMSWMPQTPDLPEPLRGKTVASLRVCYIGDAAEGEKLIEPLRSVAPALIDTVAEIPWTAADSIYMDPKHPIPFQQRGALFREVNSQTVDMILSAVRAEAEIPMLLLDIRHLGGVFRNTIGAGNAICGRDAAYMLNAVALSTPDISAAATAGLNQIIAAIAPWCTGRSLVNSTGNPTTEESRALCWEEDTYDKICELVTKVDPRGLIRYGFAIGREKTSS